MKKLVLVVFVTASSAAFAQQKDTTVILQPERVEIVSDDSSLSVKVDNKDQTFEASMFNEDATLEVEKHRLNFLAPFTLRKKWDMQPFNLIPISEISAGLLIPGGQADSLPLSHLGKDVYCKFLLARNCKHWQVQNM